jgi:CheY-like chemotaxis protein
MAITKSFVDKMGGTIDVKTKQGEGTTLTIRLSFETAAPEEQPDEEREKGNRTDFRDVRLLLVEDNPINQEIAVMLLSNEGFLVDCAEDGQAAVDAILQAEPGTYDAVLMDIQMPVMDGYQATRTIRALDDPARAGVPIVALTADAFQEDQKKAYDAGMQGHIAKPIDMKQMLDTLKSILGR